MGICPNCGEWVDDGDICMCCGGSAGVGYEDERISGGYVLGRRSSYTPPSKEESEKRELEFLKRRV